MKTYLLDIHFSDGDDYTYWSKGHHTPADFCAALVVRDETLVPQPGQIKQTYWRYMPAQDYECGGYMESRPGPGAFPVTYYEVP